MKLKLTDSNSVSMYRPDGPLTPDPKKIAMTLRIGNYRKSNREAKQQAKRKDIKIKILHSSRGPSKQESNQDRV